MNEVLDAYHLGAAPLGAAVGALFLIVLVRSHATYWAGRGVVRGTQLVHDSTKAPQWYRATFEHLEKWTGTRAAQKGLDLVRRWGPWAVTLAYLTVGVQTAVFAASGLIKMPYLRFTLASLPGSLAWALVWATVGLGAVYGAIQLFVASPLLFLAVAALLVVGGGYWWRKRLLRKARLAPDPAAHGEDAPA